MPQETHFRPWLPRSTGGEPMSDDADDDWFEGALDEGDESDDAETERSNQSSSASSLIGSPPAFRGSHDRK